MENSKKSPIKKFTLCFVAVLMCFALAGGTFLLFDNLLPKTEQSEEDPDANKKNWDDAALQVTFLDGAGTEENPWKISSAEDWAFFGKTMKALKAEEVEDSAMAVAQALSGENIEMVVASAKARAAGEISSTAFSKEEEKPSSAIIKVKKTEAEVSALSAVEKENPENFFVEHQSVVRANWADYAATDFDNNMELENDIDLSDYRWMPIEYFSGNFNGNGHTIKDDSSGGRTFTPPNAFGLFSVCERAELNDFNVKLKLNADYSNYKTEMLVGGVVGLITDSTISNLKVDITMNLKDQNWANVGGIVGWADRCELTNLTANVDIKYDHKRANSNDAHPRYLDYDFGVGGIIGGAEYCDFEKCYTYGSVHSSIWSGKGAVGGIVGCATINAGAAADGGIIRGCINSASVSCFVDGNVKSVNMETEVGGIVGRFTAIDRINFSPNRVNDGIYSCINCGDITVGRGNTGCGAGGIVGKLIGWGVLRGCINYGKVYTARDYEVDNKAINLCGEMIGACGMLLGDNANLQILINRCAGAGTAQDEPGPVDTKIYGGGEGVGSVITVTLSSYANNTKGLKTGGLKFVDATAEGAEERGSNVAGASDYDLFYMVEYDGKTLYLPWNGVGFFSIYMDNSASVQASRSDYVLEGPIPYLIGRPVSYTSKIIKYPYFEFTPAGRLNGSIYAPGENVAGSYAAYFGASTTKYWNANIAVDGATATMDYETAHGITTMQDKFLPHMKKSKNSDFAEISFGSIIPFDGIDQDKRIVAGATSFGGFTGGIVAFKLPPYAPDVNIHFLETMGGVNTWEFRESKAGKATITKFDAAHYDGVTVDLNEKITVSTDSGEYWYNMEATANDGYWCVGIFDENVMKWNSSGGYYTASGGRGLADDTYVTNFVGDASYNSRMHDGSFCSSTYFVDDHNLSLSAFQQSLKNPVSNKNINKVNPSSRVNSGEKRFTYSNLPNELYICFIKPAFKVTVEYEGGAAEDNQTFYFQDGTTEQLEKLWTNEQGKRVYDVRNDLSLYLEGLSDNNKKDNERLTAKVFQKIFIDVYDDPGQNSGLNKKRFYTFVNVPKDETAGTEQYDFKQFLNYSVSTYDWLMSKISRTQLETLKQSSTFSFSELQNYIQRLGYADLYYGQALKTFENQLKQELSQTEPHIYSYGDDLLIRLTHEGIDDQNDSVSVNKQDFFNTWYDLESYQTGNYGGQTSLTQDANAGIITYTLLDNPTFGYALNNFNVNTLFNNCVSISQQTIQFDLNLVYLQLLQDASLQSTIIDALLDGRNVFGALKNSDSPTIREKYQQAFTLNIQCFYNLQKYKFAGKIEGDGSVLMVTYENNTKNIKTFSGEREIYFDTPVELIATAGPNSEFVGWQLNDGTRELVSNLDVFDFIRDKDELGEKGQLKALYSLKAVFLSNQNAAIQPNFVDGVYEIASKEHLQWLARMVNSGENNYADGQPISNHIFRLVEDIDLGQSNLEPIGTEEHPFTGIFDGNFKKISNYIAKRGAFDAYASNRGLFGVTDGATIKNLYVDDVLADGYMNVGAVVGHAKNTIFQRVESFANSLIKISGSAFENDETFDRIVFANNEKTRAEYSTSTHKVTMTKNDFELRDNFGGLVGLAENCQFFGCANRGALQTNPNVGKNFAGLVGKAANCNFDQCFNSVAVSNTTPLKNFANADAATTFSNCLFGEIKAQIGDNLNSFVNENVEGKTSSVISPSREETILSADSQIWGILDGKLVLKIFYWL